LDLIPGLPFATPRIPRGRYENLPFASHRARGEVKWVEKIILNHGFRGDVKQGCSASPKYVTIVLPGRLTGLSSLVFNSFWAYRDISIRSLLVVGIK
jgi:hypothetical protein